MSNVPSICASTLILRTTRKAIYARAECGLLAGVVRDGRRLLIRRDALLRRRVDIPKSAAVMVIGLGRDDLIELLARESDVFKARTTNAVVVVRCAALRSAHAPGREVQHRSAPAK